MGVSQNKVKVVLSTITLAALAATAVNEAQAATTAIGVSARIIDSQLILTQTTPLNFGTMTLTGGGTITVKADGTAPTVTGGINLVGNPVQEGMFKIRGENGKTASFTMPATAKISNGSKTMTVDNFKMGTSSKNPSTYTMLLNGTFQSSIPVGGRLTVGAGQATGTYTGTVTITANYL